MNYGTAWSRCETATTTVAHVACYIMDLLYYVKAFLRFNDSHIWYRIIFSQIFCICMFDLKSDSVQICGFQEKNNSGNRSLAPLYELAANCKYSLIARYPSFFCQHFICRFLSLVVATSWVFNNKFYSIWSVVQVSCHYLLLKLVRFISQ